MLKPHKARVQKFCSRTCLHNSMRKDGPPVANKAKKTYGQRTCPTCSESYEAKTKHQKFCSQACSTKGAQDARRDSTVQPRPCEHCGSVFRPRPGSAGRFCSRPCTYAGSTGEKAAHWKGGRHVSSGGYVKVWAPKGHPAAQGNGGYVAEHRLVMERALGRYLERHETVHHINGDTQDNRLENLQLRFGSHGRGQAARCRACGSHDVEFTALE